MDIHIFTGIQFKEKAEMPLKSQKVISIRNIPDGYTYFYWYSVQGEGGNAVEESESYIDKKHIEYWDECIDPEYKPVDMKLEENLIAPAVERIIGQNTEN